jgi:RHS repeat-associated protein
MGRRFSKQQVGSATASHYIYDGWNLITEYTGTTLAKSYTWGMDLSGSMQGAGGVGGLLAVKEGTFTYYPTYDGNGNVSEYLGSSNAVQAHYEYDAFGNITVATGIKKDDFLHRFSTKPLDSETGLYYYGYRYYDPVTGRWSSRDPIAENGGVNLYGFVGNSGVSKVDILGLAGAAETELLAALAFAKDVMVGTITHKKKSGMMVAAINTLSVVVGTLDDVIYDPSGLASAGAYAMYVSFYNEIRINAGVEGTTAMHELVHAFNDSSDVDAATNEGMAYGIEKLYELHLHFDALIWKELDILSVNEDCSKVRDYAHSRWKVLTSKLDVSLQPKTYPIYGGFGGMEETAPMNNEDYYALRDRLGAYFSCGEAAGIVNNSSFAKKCCFKVSCAKGARTSASDIASMKPVTFTSPIVISEAFN